jgi:rare lipoprotein A
VGNAIVIKRRRASRRRYQRPRAATLLALLVGLSVVWCAHVLTLRGRRFGAALKSGVQAPLAARTGAAFGRRALQRWALAAYLVGPLIGLAPAGANAGGPFGLTSHTVLGIYQSMPRVAARVCEMQVEVGHTTFMSAVVAHSNRLVASQLPHSEPEVAKMPPGEVVNTPPAQVAKTPPAEEMKATSVVESSVYQGDGRPSAAARGIATWYGGIDGYDPEDTMADGTPFNPDDPTIAASNQWPLGTRLMVCHGERCIPVCVRDRGNFGHAVDLSRAAFALLAPLSSGVIDVTVEVLP